MSFRKISRDRLRTELAAAIAALDVQAVHSLIAYGHGGVDDLDAVIGTGPSAQAVREALIASYKDWAEEMRGDDVADEVPSVLMVLDQPDLWSAVNV